MWTNYEFAGRGNIALFSLVFLLLSNTFEIYTFLVYFFAAYLIFVCVKRTSVNYINLLSPVGGRRDVTVSLFKCFLFYPCLKKILNLETEDIACNLQLAEQNCIC